MALTTIRPQYKIGYVLDDDLQVAQVAGAYLPTPNTEPVSNKERPTLLGKEFTVGEQTFQWLDHVGLHCINLDYS